MLFSGMLAKKFIWLLFQKSHITKFKNWTNLSEILKAIITLFFMSKSISRREQMRMILNDGNFML